MKNRVFVRGLWVCLAGVALLIGCTPPPDRTNDEVGTTQQAVSGAAFTTFNPSVDGNGNEVCKNSIINCNIYGAKEYVWLNGGPTANGLGPDGDYFFAVLEPGGQPDPNDREVVAIDKNLSDDFDKYTNRTFTVVNGEVEVYEGDHWFDSNTEYPNGCHNAKQCGSPDGKKPFIRLFPYTDTTNPGGVYILAICSLADGYPVKPRDCKYDAFKVKDGKVTYDFLLDGYKIHDRDGNGILTDPVDVGLQGWTITVKGTGFLGEEIDYTASTDDSGYWFFQSPEYSFVGQNKPVSASLQICEELKSGWVQSVPGEDQCYDIVIDPEGVTFVGELSFGNYMPIEITGCKNVDDHDPVTAPVPYEGWTIYLLMDGEVIETQLTGEDGCYRWTGLEPGHTYAIEEADPLAWVPATSDALVDFGYVLSGDGPFSHTWTNVPAQGCTPGFWQGGSQWGQAGGQWLWNDVDDPHWPAAGGAGFNPYTWDTLFNDFFQTTPVVSSLVGKTMMDLVGTGGGDIDAQKAARSMVAAYLNASFGIAYAYNTGELMAMWIAAAETETFLELHTLLDAANNHFDNPDGECPISASIPVITIQ